ncbi:MAG TPA: hypothetical protein QGH28_07480 [Chloroflexota bacterium]|nr:hypothetical protein [Chloroflexota bacterium]
MRRTLLLLLLLAGLIEATPAAAADYCPFTALDDGCLYTNTGADTADPFDGFAVTIESGIPFWNFHRGLSVQAVGWLTEAGLPGTGRQHQRSRQRLW